MTSNTHFRAFSASVAIFTMAFLVAFLVSSLASPTRDTNAEGTNDDNSSASGYSLSLSTTSNVNLNLTVGTVDVMTVGEGQVQVSTTSTNGYKLYIGMKTNSTSLTKSGTSDAIAGTAGSIIAPQSLTRGTWGYAIPSNTAHVTTNGFSSTYTTMNNATPDGSYRFATPPASNANPALIAANTAATTGDTYPIFYGVRANRDTAEGVYSNNVLFTAIADAGTTHSASVLPTAAVTNTATPFVLTTTLYSTSTVDLNVYFLTQSQYNTVDGGTPVENVASALTCTKTSSSPVAMSCTAPASSNGTYYIYAKSPRYDITYFTTFTVTAAPNFYTISNMQEMTTAICNSVVTPSITAVDVDTNGMHLGDPAYVPQRVLSDTRDGNDYIISKLQDGNCWMTQNLRLGSSSSKILLSQTDSDVTTSFELPIAQTSGADVWSDWQDTVDSKHVYATNNTSYGNYYNWFTATAGTGTYTMASTSTTNLNNASSSICPKGWRLPDGGWAATKSWHVLDIALGGSGGNRGGDITRRDKYIATPLSFPFSSFYSYQDGMYPPDGSRGYWWSRSAYTSTGYAYGFYIGSDGTILVQGNLIIGSGFSVRCVSK